MNRLAQWLYHLTTPLRMWRSMALFKQTAVRLHLGHTKIAGWEDGLPVRSLLIPVEGSSAFVMNAARHYTAHRYDLHYPGLATLSLTARCDCACAHCGAASGDADTLDAAGWCDIIRQAMALGVFTFSITGGEPLLRDDLTTILRAIDPARAVGVVFTNGSQLAARAASLRCAGLRRIYVSIDFATAAQHDAHRRHAGLFDTALAGVAAARTAGMLVGLSTFATPERLECGALEQVLQLGARLRVNELVVFDGLPAGQLCNDTALRQEAPAYRTALRALIERWWADPTTPAVWWYGHLRSFSSCGCPGGTSMFNISPSGDVRPCDFCHTTFGSACADGLEAAWLRLNGYARRKRLEGISCWLHQPTNPSSGG